MRLFPWLDYDHVQPAKVCWLVSHYAALRGMAAGAQHVFEAEMSATGVAALLDGYMVVSKRIR